VTQTTIDVEALRELLDRGKPVTVLDIRRAEARAEWAIPGSIHVDAYDALRSGAPDALANVDLPKEEPVVTVCNVGKTGAIAAEQLRTRGFEARSLAGGMKAWSLAWNSAEVRDKVEALGASEDAFVETILESIPPTPPNHHRIVELNESGLFPEGDPTDLEAGANRCAVTS